MDMSPPCTPAADYRTDTVRADGWTYKRQALFLMTLAESGLVSEACAIAGMSLTSAYKLRQRPEGITFALGWKAAVLLARNRLEDVLLAAAITGVEAVSTKVEGVTRRRTVNSGLSMGVLNRLDRLATTLDDQEAAMTRASGAAFEDYVVLIASGGGIEDVAAFLDRVPDPLAMAKGLVREDRRADRARGTADSHELVEESTIISDARRGELPLS